MAAHKQFLLVVDDLRGHPRFNLYGIPAVDELSSTEIEVLDAIAASNSPFLQSGILEQNGITTFTLVATEP